MFQSNHEDRRRLRAEASKPLFRSLRQTLLLSSGLLIATICLAASPTRADELSDLRAEMKTMRAASLAMERRLMKLEREKTARPAGAAGAVSAGGATTARNVGAGPNAPNAGPTAAPILAQPTAGFLRIPGSDTSIKLGGFVKIDGVYDVKGGGIGGTGTDFTEIPLRGTPASRRAADFNATARQTQIALSSVTPTSSYGDLKTYVAIDFYGANNGNGLYTNSFAPRLFQAYVSADKVAGGSVLVGQAWSTFMDLDSYPETLDLNGPVGTVFIRQPMVRYVRDLGGGSKLFLAAEAPYADFEGANPYPVFSGGGAPSTNIRDPIPDFVAKYTYDAKWGHVAVAGIARYINADTGGALVNGFSGNTGVFGGGFMGAATIKTVGKDTINFQGVGGPGIGRYLFGEDDSGGSAASLVTCGNAVACGLRTTTGFGGAVSYQHYWTDKVRSNFIGGVAHYNDEFPDNQAGSTRTIVSAFANLIYSPLPTTDIGLEFIYGSRSVLASPAPGIGAEGQATRVLGTVKVGY